MYNKEKEQDELYSQQISAGKRKYFFDVKATKNGDKFITISESRKMFNNDTGVFYFDKNRMFLYKEDFEKFQHALQNAIHYIDTGEAIPAPDYGGEHHNDHEDHDDDSLGCDINDIHINEI